MNEKLIGEFMSLGCKTRRNAAVCLQVYLDLCEVKRFWDINYMYSESCETMYISCRRSKNAPISIYVPCFVSDNLSFAKMQEYLSLSQAETPSVFLSILTADSTLVYYEIEKGIGQPLPEVSELSREEKRENLDTALRKHKKLLEQSALYGVAITLPKKNNIQAVTEPCKSEENVT